MHPKSGHCSSHSSEAETQDDDFLSEQEDGNADLSLDIVAKARSRRPAKFSPLASSYASDGTSCSEDGDVERLANDTTEKEDISTIDRDLGMDTVIDVDKVADKRALQVVKPAKKKLRKKIKKKAIVTNEGEDRGKTKESQFKVVSDDAADNLVMRKLLRGPRYFDQPEEKTCFRCGKEGHLAADCMDEPRKKPCYTCGEFGHERKDCPRECCFICKGVGHFAKSCPKKGELHEIDRGSTRICLLCGEMGHVYSVCYKGYSADDMKMIQCYICKNYGHLCCVDIMDSSSTQISCYNCGEIGHAGVGCAKSRTVHEDDDTRPAKLCYKCGQEGHFARGCSKPDVDRWFPDPQTPDMSLSQGFLGFKSVPREVGAHPRWKDIRMDERHARTSGFSTWRGHLNMDTRIENWNGLNRTLDMESVRYAEKGRHERSRDRVTPQFRKRQRISDHGGWLEHAASSHESHFKRRGERGYRRSHSGKKRFLSDDYL